MKNRLAIYFSVLAMAVLALSCSSDDDAALSPYAYVKSFGIGDFNSSYPTFTDAGKDTVIDRKHSGSSWKFTIDQAACRIYNSDSLPFATNLSKLVVSMSVDGVASIYNDKSDAFEYFSGTDSIDFTSPRTLRITSLDGSYFKDYLVTVSAHKVDPDKMVWSKIETPNGILPVRLLEFGEDMLLLGKNQDNPALALMPLSGNSAWAPVEISGLPPTADFTTAAVFNEKLYVLADGNLYTSDDAASWSCASQGNDLVAIVGASSDKGGAIWTASTNNLFCSTDGVSFENKGELPDGFPLYGISSVAYPLSHNKNIIRFVLVGYSEQDKSGAPKVWSRLSTESAWVEYSNAGNPYPCPSLADITVLHYDNFLYAFGGKGFVDGKDVEAFSSFYVSKDNGIVWKAMQGYMQQLPKELVGKNVPFAATVDSNNRIWVMTADGDAGAWRGLLNRLGFEK